MRCDQTCERGHEGHEKSDVLAAAELFCVMPHLESVTAFLSLFVSHSKDDVKCKRIFAMHDISLAHFHGVLVRRKFELLPDEEKEKLARATLRWKLRPGTV